MLLLIGLILITLGLIIIKFGDRVVSETFLDKLQSKFAKKEMILWGRKFQKWLIGVVLIIIGIQLLLIHF